MDEISKKRKEHKGKIIKEHLNQVDVIITNLFGILVLSTLLIYSTL